MMEASVSSGHDRRGDGDQGDTATHLIGDISITVNVLRKYSVCSISNDMVAARFCTWHTS